VSVQAEQLRADPVVHLQVCGGCRAVAHVVGASHVLLLLLPLLLLPLFLLPLLILLLLLSVVLVLVVMAQPRVHLHSAAAGPRASPAPRRRLRVLLGAGLHDRSGACERLKRRGGARAVRHCG
jgi:hypothetical protein